MIEPMTYFGTFWIPNNEGKKMFGTYTYKEDGSSIIEIHIDENDDVPSKCAVLFGEITGKHKITFFDVNAMIRKTSYISYSVKYALTGIHLSSLEENIFDRCTIRYQHLNSWIRSNCKLGIMETEKETDVLWYDIYKDDDITVSLHWSVEESIVPFYSCELKKVYYISFNTLKNTSVCKFVELVTEITQLLSFILQSEQYPQKIIFKNVYSLLFNVKKSQQPKSFPLIPFEIFKDKMSSIYNNWHNLFSHLSPIYRYYFNTLSNGGDFDVPDFITVAQALDGYHKRFINKKDGRDIRQYPQQLKQLLDIFDDVEVIKKCNIDTSIFAKLRHGYVHLYPEEEQQITISSKDLYALTQKGIVLLTCCFLHLLGLNNQEINICFQKNKSYYIILENCK